MSIVFSRRIFFELASLVAAKAAANSKVATANDAGNPPLPEPEPVKNHIVLAKDMYIAGTMYIAGIDELVESLAIGQLLTFVREPHNLHDALAIRVFADDARLGYVPRKHNEVLARLMDSGKSVGAKITWMEKRGWWNKIHMEVFLDDEG